MPPHHVNLSALWCAWDYDYDKSDDLPLGCEYSDEHLSNSTGVLQLSKTFDTGRAPTVAPSPSKASAKASTAAPMLGAVNRTSVNPADTSEAVLSILCKPMPARTAPPQQSAAAQQSKAGSGGAAHKLNPGDIFLIAWGDWLSL